MNSLTPAPHILQMALEKMHFCCCSKSRVAELVAYDEEEAYFPRRSFAVVDTTTARLLRRKSQLQLHFRGRWGLPAVVGDLMCIGVAR